MKLMILSYPFYGYGEMISKAFMKKKCSVKYLSYGYPSNGIKNLFRYSLPRKIGIDVEYKLRENFALNTIKQIQEFEPDAILLIRGDFLSDTLIEGIKKSKKRPQLNVWIMDGINKLPGLMQFKNNIDKWFVFEPTDISILKKNYNIKAQFLPLAFDPSYYFPLENDENQDLTANMSFIGSVKDKERIETIDKLSKWSIKNKFDFKIVTANYRARNYHLLYPYRSLWKKLYKNYLPHELINILYNNCNVNINIHKKQSIEGLNMRFFEVLGSGGLQLVEEKKGQKILNLKPGSDFLTYSCYEDMIEKIEYAFSNPEKVREISVNALRKSKKHTFQDRAQQIISEISIN
jgi:spore maturation protein CgeB